MTPTLLILRTTGLIIIGLLIGALALDAAWWGAVPLLPVSWLLTTSGMRMFYVVIEHACVHNILAKSPRSNRIIGEIISTLLWAARYALFRQDHKVHHLGTRTERDPDAHFLVGTGFRPGMSRDEFRWYIAWTLISPRYHLWYFKERMRFNFTAPPLRTAMSCVYAAALLTGLAVTGLWMEWLVIWVFPTVILYQMSSLINYHSEHRWPESDGSCKLSRARLSYGRFCGDPTPVTTGARPLEWARAWAVWWLRVAFIHVPYKLFVLVGDLPQHDLHHRRPGSDWANAAYVRRDDIAAGCPDWPETYSDEWGTVLDHLDASISRWSDRVASHRAGLAMPLATPAAAKGEV